MTSAHRIPKSADSTGGGAATALTARVQPGADGERIPTPLLVIAPMDVAIRQQNQYVMTGVGLVRVATVGGLPMGVLLLAYVVRY